jgi:hypothetical protein
MWKIGLMIVLAIEVAGCCCQKPSDIDLDDDSSTESESSATSKKKGSKRKTKRKKSGDSAKVRAFWTQEIQACNAYQIKVGNSKPGEKKFDGSSSDPSRSIKIVKKMPGNKYQINDAAGTSLIVDMNKKQFTSLQGPGGPVPRPYTFCDSKVWVGTMDE